MMAEMEMPPWVRRAMTTLKGCPRCKRETDHDGLCGITMRWIPTSMPGEVGVLMVVLVRCPCGETIANNTVVERWEVHEAVDAVFNAAVVPRASTGPHNAGKSGPAGDPQPSPPHPSARPSIPPCCPPQPISDEEVARFSGLLSRVAFRPGTKSLVKFLQRLLDVPPF